MKTKILMLLFFISFLGLAQKITTWIVDKDHSKVQFEVSHMIVSDVVGEFTDFDGQIETQGDDFSTAQITGNIRVNSINTGNAKRDKHLKSPDFFDAGKYPVIHFKSKKIVPLGKNKYKIIGDLTMHGVTREVELEGKFSGTVKDPWGNIRAGFKMTGTVDRTDFGIKYNSVMDNGGLMIGNDVDMKINLELIKK